MIQHINAKDISKFFVSKTNIHGDYITNLKLQKLLYYAQAWNLVKNKKELFLEDFEAWIHGPVIPSIYKEFKKFKYKPITLDLGDKFIHNLKNRLDNKTFILLEKVFEKYSPISAFTLELMTHKEEPWFKARNGIAFDENSNNIISKELIKKYFSKLSFDESN